MPSIIALANKDFIKRCAVLLFLNFTCQRLFADLVDEICISNSSRARLAATIEFKSHQIGNSTDPSGLKTSLVGDMKYYHQGSMYRVEIQGAFSANGEITNQFNLISAYNDRDYEILNIDDNSLAIKKTSHLPNPSYLLNPMILPYGFMFKLGSTSTWSVVQSVDAWRLTMSKAVYLGQSFEDGLTLEKYNIPGNTGVQYIVYFASKLHFYPVKYLVRMNDTQIGTLRALSYTIRNVDNEEIVVPTEVSCSQSLGGDVVEDVITVDVSSILINQQLPNDLFSLSSARVKAIRDVDRDDARFSQEEANERLKQIQNPQGTIIHWTIIANILAIVCIGIGVYIFRKSR